MENIQQQAEQAKLEAQRDYELKQQQLQMQQAQFDQEYKLKQQQLSASTSSSSGSSASISKSTSKANVPYFSNYNQAASWLKSQGISSGSSGMMTKNEWLGRKQRGSQSAETKYPSYEAYINAYVEWLVENR